MTKDETDKLLAELEAQQAALDAEFEALGLSDYDEAEPFNGYPEIVQVAYEARPLVPSLLTRFPVFVSQ